jgi:hypothetical protein
MSTLIRRNNVACGPVRSLLFTGNRMQLPEITIMKRIKIVHSGFCWQPVRNIGLTLGAALRRVVALREGGPTTNWCRTALSFGRYVASLHKEQGWRGVVIRLKANATLLQQVAGGHKLDNPRLLGCAISRSRNGIPRVFQYYTGNG